MAARGKTIALWSAGLGLLVLLGGVVAVRERIAEEWHLHKLRTGDLREARRAAEELGKMGSVRAVPALLEAPGRRLKALPPADGSRPTHYHELGAIVVAKDRLEPRLPFPVVPKLELPVSRQNDRLVLDGINGAAIVTSADRSEAQEALDIFRWASAAIAQIGERAVPALEKSAANETLDSAARIFASFELTLRARASPRIVLKKSVQLTVQQGTSIPIPGSQGSVYLSAGEFQRKTALVWITPSAGDALVEKRLLASGHEVSFSVGGKGYALQLEDVLFAMDRAVFWIREKQPE